MRHEDSVVNDYFLQINSGEQSADCFGSENLLIF